MILTAFSIVIAVLLIAVILLQRQGSGLSASFGGTGEVYRSKRSIEKMLIWLTIILTSLFGGLSILLLLPH